MSMKLRGMQFVLSYAKYRTNNGVQKQFVAESENLVGFEIRMNLPTRGRAEIWWKQFARFNSIPKKNWVWADTLVKDAEKLENKISAEFIKKDLNNT